MIHFISLKEAWLLLFRVVGFSVISLLFFASSTLHLSRGGEIQSSDFRLASPLLTYYCQTVAMTLKNNEQKILYDSPDFPFQETGADRNSQLSLTLCWWPLGCPLLCPASSITRWWEENRKNTSFNLFSNFSSLQVGECRWSKGGKPVGMFGGKYEMRGDTEQGDCSLTLHSLDLRIDDGQWQCQVSKGITLTNYAFAVSQSCYLHFLTKAEKTI